MLNDNGTFYPCDGQPIFGVQSSWICFSRGGCKRGVPDNADIAFIYLQTYRTKLQKELKLLIDEGVKKADALKECSILKNRNDELTRIQCPSLGFDEEGLFKDVYPAFIQCAKQKASSISGLAFEQDESCITAAWVGETRATIHK